MSVISDIGRDLHALVKMWAADGMQAFSAEVLSVDVSTRSCSVRSISSETEMEYPEVWLMPEKVDGILYVPKVGSTVIVENNANLQPYIGMWSKIDEILYVVGSTTFSMTPGLTKFNDGAFGGIPIVGKVEENFTTLKNYIKNILEPAIGNAFTAVGAGGAASGPNGKISFDAATTGQVITVEDMEDTAVTH